jgi:hypothetical protein
MTSSDTRVGAQTLFLKRRVRRGTLLSFACPKEKKAKKKAPC